MYKKFYVAPEQELIEIASPEILAGSAGDGLNDDFSAPTTDTPSDTQPEEW